MTDLEKGRSKMKNSLPGIKPPDRILVIVARTSTDTKALTQDIRTIKALTAVAEAKVYLRGPARKVDAVRAQRVFVLWRSYGNRSVKERRMVIAHELTHAALVKRSGGRVPPWLSRASPCTPRATSARATPARSSAAPGSRTSPEKATENVLSLTRLAKPTALDSMSPIPLTFAYSYASAAAYAIAAKHGGAKALLRLYSGSTARRSRASRAASSPTA